MWDHLNIGFYFREYWFEINVIAAFCFIAGGSWYLWIHHKEKYLHRKEKEAKERNDSDS